jgi:hypothetical protein
MSGNELVGVVRAVFEWASLVIEALPQHGRYIQRARRLEVPHACANMVIGRTSVDRSQRVVDAEVAELAVDQPKPDRSGAKKAIDISQPAFGPRRDFTAIDGPPRQCCTDHKQSLLGLKESLLRLDRVCAAAPSYLIETSDVGSWSGLTRPSHSLASATQRLTGLVLV